MTDPTIEDVRRVVGLPALEARKGSVVWAVDLPGGGWSPSILTESRTESDAIRRAWMWVVGDPALERMPRWETEYLEDR